MAGTIRVALIGGSDALRQARREVLDRTSGIEVVYDSDSFALSQLAVLDLTFDVAIFDQRLSNISAYEFVSGVQATAKVTGFELGRILISSSFSDPKLRIAAIEAGAVNAVFVSDGLEKFVEIVKLASIPDADFGAREVIYLVEEDLVDSAKYAFANSALESLDEKEVAILRNFCDLKTDSQIAQIAKVPKLKVRTTLVKVQNLLMLSTRSQLLLMLKKLGAI